MALDAEITKKVHSIQPTSQGSACQEVAGWKRPGRLGPSASFVRWSRVAHHCPVMQAIAMPISSRWPFLFPIPEELSQPVTLDIGTTFINHYEDNDYPDSEAVTARTCKPLITKALDSSFYSATAYGPVETVKILMSCARFMPRMLTRASHHDRRRGGSGGWALNL